MTGERGAGKQRDNLAGILPPEVAYDLHPQRFHVSLPVVKARVNVIGAASARRAACTALVEG